MENGKIKVAQIIGNVSEGGVEVMIANLYRNIDHSKVIFHFYVCNTSVVINKEEIESFGGKVIIVPSIKHIFKYKKCLKTHFEEEKYDIAHANMNALSFIPLRVAKKCKIDVRIAHSHSTSNKKEFLRHILKWFFKHFSRLYPTHFFACSEKAGRWLFGNKVYDSGKVHIINNAIDLEKYSFDIEKRKEFRKELNINSDLNVVGHIGRFVKQKNHKYLIEIFEQLQKINKNTVLLLVGSGDKLNEIKNLSNQKNLQNIFFTGPVENPYDYYQAMDCFVLPSLYEGLPVVGVEAQVNGLKCFFSNKITTEAKISGGTEYLSINDNPKVWAEHINTYFRNKKEMRLAEIDSDKYDIKKASSKVLDLYCLFLNKNIK